MDKEEQVGVTTSTVDSGIGANTLKEKRTCTHHFGGASRKGAPFRGWAGPIDSWPEKKAPVVAFGKWVQKPRDLNGGGVVTFACLPLAVVMWGANSKEMRSKDKTTHFGFAGLAPDGNLRIELLPHGLDARGLFAQGGWQHPNIDTIIERLASANDSSSLTSGDCHTVLETTKMEISKGFGIKSRDFELTLSSWPMLVPVLNALNTLTTKKDALDAKSAVRRRRQASVGVRRAILKLEADGCEVNQMSIAALLLQKPNLTNHDIKEKVRKLKRILGANFADV